MGGLTKRQDTQRWLITSTINIETIRTRWRGLSFNIETSPLLCVQHLECVLDILKFVKPGGLNLGCTNQLIRSGDNNVARQPRRLPRTHRVYRQFQQLSILYWLAVATLGSVRRYEQQWHFQPSDRLADKEKPNKGERCLKTSSERSKLCFWSKTLPSFWRENNDLSIALQDSRCI